MSYNAKNHISASQVKEALERIKSDKNLSDKDMQMELLALKATWMISLRQDGYKFEQR